MKRGESRDRHGDRIKKFARYFQGQAERSDDEGELADLRQPHADPQRSLPFVPGDECPKRAGNHLTDHDHRGDDQDRPGVFREQRGIDEQTDGDEEDRAEHVAHRFQEHFDPRDLARLGHDGADQKCAERDAVAELARPEARRRSRGRARRRAASRCS